MHTSINICMHIFRQEDHAMLWNKTKKGRIKQTLHEVTLCAFPLIPGSKQSDLLVQTP